MRTWLDLSRSPHLLGFRCKQQGLNSAISCKNKPFNRVFVSLITEGSCQSTSSASVNELCHWQMKALSIQIKCNFGTGKQMLPPGICSTRVWGKECRKKQLLHGTLLLAPPCFGQNPALEPSSGLCVQGADNAAASLDTAFHLQNTASLLPALSPKIQ